MFLPSKAHGYRSRDATMASEVFLQLGILILTLAIVFAVQRLPKHAFTNLRTKSRTSLQSTRHFLEGSHLLTRAKSAPHHSHSLSLSKSALSEAETAIAFSPKSPEPYILKALVLELMGHHVSALRSLDLALSPPRVKTLSEKERREALLKRAELKMRVNRKRRVDSAVVDLKEAVRVSDGSENVRVWCLLGECYEWKGLREEAKEAYEMALRIEPELAAAREGLGRVRS